MTHRRGTVAVAIAIATGLMNMTGCNAVAMGAADPSALHSRSLVEACPLGVPRTRVRAVETSQGVDIYFSAPAARIDDLRRRVRDQALVNGPDRHRGAGHDGEHGGPQNHGLRLWSLGEMTATPEDTPDGARLSVAIAPSSQQDAVRARLVARVRELEAADCPN